MEGLEGMSLAEAEAALPLTLPAAADGEVEVSILQLGRPYSGPQHENYLLRTPDCDAPTPVPVGLQTQFTLSGRSCRGAIESGKYGPLFAVTDTESGRTLRKEKLPQRAGKLGPNSNCLGQLAAELMAHLAAETGSATKVGGPSLFGMGSHQADFRAFLSAHFQPQPDDTSSDAGVSASSNAEALQHVNAERGPFAASSAANGLLLYPSYGSEPGSPARALPVAGKALSADVYGMQMQLATPEHLNLKGHAHHAQGTESDDGDFKQQRQHDSASSADYSPAAPEELVGNGGGGPPVALQGELLPPPLAKNRFGAFAKRLQGIKAPEGPPPEDPFQPVGTASGAKGSGSKVAKQSPPPPLPPPPPQQQQQPEEQPQVPQQEAQARRVRSNSSGDLAAMPFDALPAALQAELAGLRVGGEGPSHAHLGKASPPEHGSPSLRIKTGAREPRASPFTEAQQRATNGGSQRQSAASCDMPVPGSAEWPQSNGERHQEEPTPPSSEMEPPSSDSVPALTSRALGIAQRIAGYAGEDPNELRSNSAIDDALPEDVLQVGDFLRDALSASSGAGAGLRQWSLLVADEHGVKLGLLAVDASGFERTVLLTPDLGWEVDVFGMPILDTVLRNQQVPRRLRTRRDLLTLLAGAAELAVCPGCTDRGAWEQLAGDADALYAPDGATIVARVETNCFVAAGEGGGADWRCDWTVRPQTYLQDGGPVQGCHMLVLGSSICTACRRFSGDLRARLQELMLERGEASAHELYEHEDRERLATANAQRNIERLRQQIEEIKEQEAAYDPNAALAMAMFEHSEGGGGRVGEDPLLRVWAEQRERQTRSATGVLNTLTGVIENTRSEAATALIFQTSEVLSINFNLEEDEVLLAYVILLKTISMKLTPNLVELFFHPDDGGGEGASFPLYTEAVKFISHRAAPVRAAVRTLTLNLYAIEAPGVQAFLAGPQAAAYFTDLGAYMTERCQVLDKALAALQGGSPSAAREVEALLAEVEALLSYWNDILCTSEPALCQECSERLWASFLAPVVFYPLAAGDAGISATGPPEPEGPGVRRMSTNNWTRTWLPPAEKGRVRPLAALYTLERLFHVMTEPSLLNPLLGALLGGGAATGAPSLSEFRYNALEGDDGDAATSQLTPAIRSAIGHEPAAYRLAVFGILHGSDSQMVGALVRALAAALLNEAVDVDVLDCCGMLPPQSMQPPPGGWAGGGGGDMEGGKPANPFEAHAAQPDTAFSSGPETSALAEDLIDALCGLLLLPFMPAAALWHIGWLLRQLLPAAPGGGPRLTDQQCGLLESAMRLSRQFLMAELNGMWCDAMLVLIHTEWPRARGELLAPATSSTHAVVQAWMQATQVQDLMGSRALNGMEGGIEEEGPQGSGGPPEGASATAAKRMVQAVQQFVAMLQIQQTLLSEDGGVAEAPLLHPIDEEALEEAEIREGAPIERTERVPCTIALAKGKSRKVFFAVAGLPRDRRNFDGTPSDEAVVHALPVVVIVDDNPGPKPYAAMPLASPPHTPERPPQPTLTANLRSLTRKGAKQQAEAADEVAPARPAALSAHNLAAAAAASQRQPLDVGSRPLNLDHITTAARPLSRSSSRGGGCGGGGGESPAVKPGGTVLSVAPLMGTEPDADPTHAQWLHVHVRPPVRALLKVLKNSGVGDAFNNIGKQLKDGHWVLAFPSVEAANYATLLVDQHAAKLRAYYCEVMVPLLVPEPAAPSAASHDDAFY